MDKKGNTGANTDTRKENRIMMIENDVMEYSTMYELYMALSRDERIMKKETEYMRSNLTIQQTERISTSCFADALSE